MGSITTVHKCCLAASRQPLSLRECVHKTALAESNKPLPRSSTCHAHNPALLCQMQPRRRAAPGHCRAGSCRAAATPVGLSRSQMMVGRDGTQTSTEACSPCVLVCQ